MQTILKVSSRTSGELTKAVLQPTGVGKNNDTWCGAHVLYHEVALLLLRILFEHWGEARCVTGWTRVPTSAVAAAGSRQQLH